jgi:hypothetical protein
MMYRWFQFSVPDDTVQRALDDTTSQRRLFSFPQPPTPKQSPAAAPADAAAAPPFAELDDKDPMWRLHALTWINTTASHVGVSNVGCEQAAWLLDSYLHYRAETNTATAAAASLDYTSLSQVSAACLLLASKYENEQSFGITLRHFDSEQPGFAVTMKRLEPEILQCVRHTLLHDTAIAWAVRLLRLCSVRPNAGVQQYQCRMFPDVCNQLWALHTFPGRIPREPWTQALVVIGLHASRSMIDESVFSQLWSALSPPTSDIDAIKAYLDSLQRTVARHERRDDAAAAADASVVV